MKLKNMTKTQRIIDCDGKRMYLNPGDIVDVNKCPRIPEGMIEIEDKKVKKDGRTKSVDTQMLD